MAAGLGEAASIAGIVSLAFQCLEAIAATLDFCKAYNEAQADVQRALNDLELLQQVLVDVETTAAKALVPSKCPASLVAFLHKCVACCRRDLISWVSSIKPLQLNYASGVPKVWKKIKIAADGKRFSSIATSAMMHTHRINTCLELIDCGLDLEIRTETRITKTAVASLTDITNTFRSETSNNFNALSNIVCHSQDNTRAALGSVNADMRNLAAKADASIAIGQLPPHVLQQIRSELHDEFCQVKSQIDNYRKFAVQQFSLLSAAQVNTNLQLSDVQVLQFLTQSILSQCLDSHSNLQCLRHRCSQRNLVNPINLSCIVRSTKLQTWSSSKQPSLIVLQSAYTHRVTVQSFGIAPG